MTTSASMPAPAPSRLSVGEPTELAIVVPHLLGFQPHESLVLVGAVGPRRRLGLALRADLVEPAAQSALARRVTDDLRRTGADRALAAVFTDRSGDPPALPFRALVSRVDRQLPIIDALLVRGGRCWSYRCRDVTCCPREGRRIDPEGEAATRIRAAFAGMGASVLPSREAVVDCLAPETGERAAAAASALGPALAWRAARGDVETGLWARCEIARQVAGYADPRSRIEPDTAVRIGVAVAATATRDRVLADWVAAVGRVPDGDEPAGAWRRLLLDLARTVPAPYDAAALVLYACAAYHAGAGVLVETAAERALRHDPDCGLAGLLLDLLDAQVHPRRIVEAISEIG